MATVKVLVVGGGAGGGSPIPVDRQGGGGGGGAVEYNASVYVAPYITYNIVVGAGGTNVYNSPGTNGSNSSALGITASGGVGGSNAGNGGASGNSNAGGTAYTTGGSGGWGGVGGGGNGAVGNNGAYLNGGAGGNGSAYDISGTSTYYGGGGGGGAAYPGAGGLGGGGNGGNNDTASPGGDGKPGTANTGGGGGGGGYDWQGGAGGSGIVIIRYATVDYGTCLGGTKTTVGSDTVHTFTTSGTFTASPSVLKFDALLVAGGGGGGSGTSAAPRSGGGGGAGGVIYSENFILTSGTHNVVVGSGGAGSPNSTASVGTNGGNSIFNSLTAIGGGGGGRGILNTDNPGVAGGSGGGGGAANIPNAVGGAGTSGQGYAGGSASAGSSGGGGGAGAVGANAVDTYTAGNGGNGIANSISGSSVNYAGGGGGSTTAGETTQGTGGLGGGGAGVRYEGETSHGTANTGGGGGGGGRIGGNGGSGVVIIRYITDSTAGYSIKGGTITTSGIYTIHTFNSDGVFTINAITNFKLTSVEAWGAGGNGRQGGSAGSGGGGGGAYAKLNDFSLVPIQENSFSVVTGTGVDSTFGGGFLKAEKGITPGGTAGGAGGQASNSLGDVVYSGGSGGTGNTTGDTGGGGGGAAGPDGAGEDGMVGGTGTSTDEAKGGRGNNTLGGTAGIRNTSPGGDSVLGGGGGGGGSNATSGTAGGSWGGGGGGGETAGGAGGTGAVRVKYVTLNFPTCTGGTKTTEGEYTVHTFTSNGTFVVPAIDVATVTTQAVTNITANTATGNGTVVSAGNLPVIERGVCWKTSSGPTTSDSKTVSSGSTGSYTVSITGLTQDTVYYARAYAINSLGTSYGAEVTFQTAGKPTVTTQAVSAIDLTTAVFNGTVVSQNGYVVTQRGFCYGLTTNPTITGDKIIVSGTTGAYTGSPTGLPNGTLYYVRAYATNAVGTNYGEEVTFTTLTAGDKQLIKDIGATTGESYSVSINVGGTEGTVTVKLGTTGYSQTIDAGAGVTVITGEYSGLSGLIIELSEGADCTVDDVYWVKLLGGEETIDWDLDQYTSFIPIDSSVKFKRVEDKELTRFDLYRYLDAQFKDLDGYVTLTITEEANDKSQNRNKTFVVGNETGVVSPFVKKRISMLSKNQALVVQFSNAKLSETFTICEYQLSGFREPKKLYKLSKIISI